MNLSILRTDPFQGLPQGTAGADERAGGSRELRGGDSGIGGGPSQPADQRRVEESGVAGGAIGGEAERGSEEGQNSLASPAGNDDDFGMDCATLKHGHQD